MYRKKGFANFVLLSLIAVLSILTLVVVSSAAEKFPSKEIIIVVPYSAGGGQDLTCRPLAQYLQKELGVAVIIDNRPEGAAIKGVVDVYRAKPDGYTLLNVLFPRNAIAEVVFNAPFKLLDFTYLAACRRSQNFVVVRKESPYATLKDIIEASKKKSLNCGIGGIGSGSQFYAEGVLKRTIGVDLEVVPFDGNAPALMALLGGNVDLAIMSEITVVAQLRNIRLLAGFNKQRSVSSPDVPTFKELGYDIPFIEDGTTGICGPPGLPKEISKILSDALAKVIKNPEFMSKIRKMYATPIYLSGPEFRDEVKSMCEVVKRYKDIFITK